MSSQGGSFVQGGQHSRFGIPGGHSFDPRSGGGSPLGVGAGGRPYGGNAGAAATGPAAAAAAAAAAARAAAAAASTPPPPSMEASYGRPRSRHGSAQLQESYVSSNAMTPPPFRHVSQDDGPGGAGAMPEGRLKIYSDLFEEVIERDRVFGSLLRKIKTAYDMLLVGPNRPGASQPVPPLPMDASAATISAEMSEQRSWPGSGLAGGASGSIHGGGSGGLPGSAPGGHSNEPTTRQEGGLQVWEMQRENRVLKDLVERLHLELEEAVRREHRWRHKVTKLKARVESVDSGPGQHPAMMQNGLGSGMISDYTDGVDEPAWMQGLMSNPQKDLQHGDDPKRTLGSSGVPRFHAMQREPLAATGDLMADGQQEAMLNQGGLLSLSSISPQHSVVPMHADAGLLGTSAADVDSARSTDSGMLPQRLERRVIKPDYVPKLDFTRLKDALEEEEEEEEEELVEEEESRMSNHQQLPANEEEEEYSERSEGWSGSRPDSAHFRPGVPAP